MSSIGTTGGDALFLLTEIENLKKELAELEQKAQSIDSGLANSYWLSGGTGVTGDLDSYMEPGNFYCPSDSGASALLNCPTKHAFTMKVELSTGTDYASQTIREYDSGITFYRVYRERWREWRQMIAEIKDAIYTTPLEAVSLKTVEEINDYYDTMSANMKNNTHYIRSVGHAASHPTFGGGSYFLEGFKVDHEYEWQKVSVYDNVGVNTHVRSKIAGVWKEWVKAT